MKKLVILSTLAICLFFNFNASAQKDNDKRKSPHTTVKQTLVSGSEISISYGQPQVKGRTIGKDLEPKEGKVWRTGADEATVFETSKALKINGQDLPAGKYSFFTLVQNGEWTLIFNKTFDQWGAYDYKEKVDVLRVKVKPQTGTFAEKLAFVISKEGEISMNWGDVKVLFTAQ
jgi:Protein of unknown function (DUF2911)